MFKRLSIWLSDHMSGGGRESEESFANVEAAYGHRMRRRDADFRACRDDILRAGGGRLDARPNLAEAYGAAIRRLHHEGALRERIEYGPFPAQRIYHYTLTPTGELEADRLRADTPPVAAV